MKTALAAPGTPCRADAPLPIEQPEQLPELLQDGGDNDGGRAARGRAHRMALRREQRLVRRRRKPDLRRRYQAEHDERTRTMAARLHSGLH